MGRRRRLRNFDIPGKEGLRRILAVPFGEGYRVPPMHDPESEKPHEAEVADTGEFEAVIIPHMLDVGSGKTNEAEVADTGEYKAAVVPPAHDPEVLDPIDTTEEDVGIDEVIDKQSFVDNAAIRIADIKKWRRDRTSALLSNGEDSSLT